MNFFRAKWIAPLVALGCAVLFPAASRAVEPEEEAYGLPEVVVTASRVPVSRDKVGAAVTVITAKDIEMQKSRSIQDVLRRSAYVDVTRFGSPGTQTNFSLRGGNQKHVLTLVDGVPWRRALGGDAMIPSFSVENIERIEIVRGNMSTLYGSNAMSGVINIITKRGTVKPSLDAMVEVGGWRTRRSSLGLRGSAGEARYTLSAYYENSDGYSSSGNSGNTDSSGLENDLFLTKNMSASVSYPLPFYDHDLNASVSYVNMVAGLDIFGGADTTKIFSYMDQITSSIKLSRAVTDRWDYSMMYGYYEERLENTDFGNPKGSSNLTRINHTSTIDFQNNYRVKDHTLTFGWAGEIDVGKDVKRATPYAQTIVKRSMYMQDLVDWKGWTLTLGGRTDHIMPDSGIAYLPKLVARTFRTSASRPIDEQTRFHGSFGTGFRDPTIFDLIFPGVSGNSRLKPEFSKGWDVGVEYSSPDNKFRGDVTYFKTRYNQLIVRQFATGNPTGPNLNANRAVTQGFDIEGNYDLTRRLSVGLTATFTQSNIEDTGTVVQGEFDKAADKKATATVRYAISDALDVVSVVRFIGKRWNSNTSTDKLAQATITDLIFNYRPFGGRAGEWSFRTENLFDEVNVESTGAAHQQRSHWLTYTWKK